MSISLFLISASVSNSFSRFIQLSICVYGVERGTGSSGSPIHAVDTFVFEDHPENGIVLHCLSGYCEHAEDSNSFDHHSEYEIR